MGFFPLTRIFHTDREEEAVKADGQPYPAITSF